MINTNLHSSMDRFEAIDNCCVPQIIKDLHSSMDRFEAQTTEICKRCYRKFTFQYG